MIDPQLLISGVIFGLSMGSIFFLMTIGLSLCFGLMRVISLDQLLYYSLGAYITYHLGAVLHLDPSVSVLLMVPDVQSRTVHECDWVQNGSGLVAPGCWDGSSGAKSSTSVEVPPSFSDPLKAGLNRIWS